MTYRSHRRSIQTALLGVAVFVAALCASTAARAGGRLVADGKPTCVIVKQAGTSPFTDLAIEELRIHIEKATGANVEVVSEGDAAKLDDETLRVVVGPGELARSLGVDVSKLKVEEYRIKTKGNALVLAGRDDGDPANDESGIVRTAPGTLYAVYDFLERELGVLWLWPGEVGTYVPGTTDLAVGDLDIRAQPDITKRRLRVHIQRSREKLDKLLYSDEEAARLTREARLWAYRQRLGTRSDYKFGHSFGHWWGLYSETKPELFAKPPEGRAQYGNKKRVKLCVSNPAVAETILDEWRAAGRPNNWPVCPNDGSGFCVCESCQKLDGKMVDNPEDIWRSQGVNLTGRYVHLWNKVLKRMKEENPDATLSSYAYSAYRDPLPGMKLEDGMVLGMVHTFVATDDWKKWSDAGAQLFLRPNWWHMGDCAPLLLLHQEGDFFRFARENGMIGFDFDSLLGYWGTQGPRYYNIARLSAHPEMTVDDVIDEYCSAFGAAAPIVKQYIGAWEDYADKCAYAVPAGGVVSVDADGLYERACREHDFRIHPIASSKRILPYLFGDDVLARPEALLKRAAAAVKDDPESAARVQFLADGLAHLRLFRDVMANLRGGPGPKMSKEELAQAIGKLVDMRREMGLRHVVWPEAMHAYSKRKRDGIYTGAAKEFDWDGI